MSFIALILLVIGLQALDCPPDTTEFDGKCVPTSCIFEGTICGDHGLCDEYGVCNCEEGYSPTHKGCQPSKCVSETSLCNDHGTCEEYSDGHYRCVCDPGYSLYNSLYYCLPDICITDGWICNDKGQCIDATDDHEAYCLCDNTSDGPQCENCVKDGVIVNDRCIYKECATTYPDGSIDECNDAGICIRNSYGFMCRCDYDAITVGVFECISHKCLPENHSQGVCSNHGYCKRSSCVCDEGYSGKYCEKSSKGCADDETLLHEICYPTKCLANPTDPNIVPCSGIGLCNYKTKECNCPVEYSGDYCELCAVGALLINGVCVDNACLTYEDNGNVSICNGHGVCIKDPSDWFRCRCDLGYRLVGTLECIPESCISGTSYVCNRHGKCVNERCHCDTGFSGKLCQSYNLCSQDQEYILGYCVPKVCATTYWDNSKAICGGYGHCIDTDDGPKCECIKDGQFINGTCVSKACISDPSTNTVCSNNGKCLAGICYCESHTQDPVCAQ